MLLASAVQAVDFMHGPDSSGIKRLYPGDGIHPSSIQEWHQDWYAFVGGGSQWKLIPATLKISQPPDIRMPFQVASSVGDAKYFLRGKEISPGPVKGAEFGWKRLRSGGTIDLNAQTAHSNISLYAPQFKNTIK